MNDKIFLTAMFSNNQITGEGEFDVSFDGGISYKDADKIGPGRGFLDLSGKTYPLPIRIRLKSKTKHHWDIYGDFEYRGNGNLAVLQAPDEFQPPRTVGLFGHFNAVSVVAYLARVRDVTEKVLGKLRIVPTGLRTSKVDPKNPPPYPIRQDLPDKSRHPWHPDSPGHPLTWHVPRLDDLNYIIDPPIEATGLLNFLPQTLSPNTLDMVLEVKFDDTKNVRNAPKLIAVSWPEAVIRTGESPPTPFLIYFHPHMSQEVHHGYYENIGQDPYPCGWDYLFYGLWRYVNYSTDPLQDPNFKGLAYQIAASGKNIVLVLPLNKSGVECGVFLIADKAEELLNEINAFMFRRAGIYTPPALGRTALAGFSGGVALVENLLGSMRNSNHLSTLKELYIFDRNTGRDTELTNPLTIEAVNSAITWAGSDSTKRVRVYSQIELPRAPNYRRLIGKSPTVPPSFTHSDDGMRTVAILPARTGCWRRPADRLDVHQLISATMLTDALRRSDF